MELTLWLRKSMYPDNRSLVFKFIVVKEGRGGEGRGGEGRGGQGR
jgi:hypothetical protein